MIYLLKEKIGLCHCINSGVDIFHFLFVILRLMSFAYATDISILAAKLVIFLPLQWYNNSVNITSFTVLS